MKEKNQSYKTIFWTLIIVFGLATIYATKFEEPPRIILFLGRFHPLLLHLPIGALVVTFFLDLMGRFQKNYPEVTVRNLLGFTGFFAIITCFIGYFLSLEGGYHEKTLDLHFYTGILTAILTCGLFLLARNSNYHKGKIFFPVFVVSMISISVAGHFGSVLTHGDNFLTEYASVPEKEKTIEVVDSLKMYDNVVAKILDAKCIQCHNTTKRKGELSLISKSDILKGGENGKALVPGNAAGSILYSHLLLPISDENHMPPEGKEQLTKDEIWLLKYWINEGSNFENNVTNVAENDTLQKLLKKYLVFSKVEIAKAPSSDIEEVRNAGFRVLEIVPQQAELSVKSLDSLPSENAMKLLSDLKEQIVELDLSNSEINDKMTSVLKKLKNLKSLRLNSSSITDETLKNLKNLENLEVLNLYGTKISDQGLTQLLTSIQPKKIYTWETQVKSETAIQLQEQFNVSIHNNIDKDFVEISKMDVPKIIPERTLFKDTIHLRVKSKLKNVDFRYTLNGEIPDSSSSVFKDKIILDKSQVLKVATFKEGWLPSDILTHEFIKVKHTSSSFTISKEPDASYAKAEKLFDLEEGTLSFKDGQWTGFFGYNLNTTIDLGASKQVDHISFSCLEDVGSWILFPKRFVVYASEIKDGNFRKLGEVAISREGQGGEVQSKKVTLDIPETTARYFKVFIENHKTLPSWHPNAGNPSWLFVDEIFFW